MTGKDLLNNNGQKVQIHLDSFVYNFKIFKYTNGRIGMYLESEDDNSKTYLTVNDSAKKVKENEFYLRNHDQFKGLGDFLYNEGVVEAYFNETLVGVKKFVICKLRNL